MNRFTDNGDGTITDHATGLVWEAATRGEMAWQEALNSCAALRLAGHDDWRLPTIQELLTLVDYERYNPACDPVFAAQSDFYWSSSTYQYNRLFAWSVYLDAGGIGANYKTLGGYVRAVRGPALAVQP